MRTESHHVVVTVTKKHLEIVNWKYRKLVFCFGTAEVKYRAVLENESEAYVEHEDITYRRFCYSMIWRQWLCISSFNFCFKLGRGLSPWTIYIAYINAVECSHIDRQKAKFQMALIILNQVWSPSANVHWVGSNVCKKKWFPLQESQYYSFLFRCPLFLLCIVYTKTLWPRSRPAVCRQLNEVLISREGTQKKTGVVYWRVRLMRCKLGVSVVKFWQKNVTV